MDRIKEYIVQGVAIIVVGVLLFVGYQKIFPPKEVTAQCIDINIMLPNGNRVIGEVGLGNGQVWIPQETLQKMLNTKMQWSKREKTLYIGTVPSAQIMSSIIPKPFNMNGMAYSNSFSTDTIMKIGGKEYSLGYSFKNINNAQFNLSNQYNSIQGIVGLEDYTSSSGGVVEIYLDDELVQTYKLDPKQLEQKLSIDVTGALKLSFIFKDFDYNARINLANMYIN
ncbi:MAG: hypothetical protein E7231_09770 [Cellulosilyticum sp.]|nr:hypothetical protein [Cellulosilyticum sp.]